MRTPVLRPINQLTAEWTVTSRGTASRRALRRLADAESEVAALGVPDLAGLVDRLRQARGVAHRERAARVVQAMLRSADVDPLIRRAILQALVPGLIGVARRLEWGAGGDWDDGAAFFGDVAATAWEVIDSWAGEDRPYAVLDLLSAVRCRLRRQLLHDRSAQEQAAPGFDDSAMQGIGGRRRTPVAMGSRRATVDPWSAAGLTDLERLAAAIDEGRGNGLDPLGAAVVYGHRVLGLSMAEMARMSGKPRRLLDLRRQRAEQVLCA